MKVTINKIAQLAGVSKTTVSLVMNGKSREARISPATEKRVLRIVRELDYSPSRLARNFRLHRSGTIGFILPDLKNPFFSHLSHAMERVARQNNYQLLIGCSNDVAATEIELAQNFFSSAIEGLIIASAINTEDLVRKIYDTDIPAIFIDREIMTERISSVSSDNFQGTYDIVNYLCSIGVREIGYTGGNQELSTTRERFRGYTQALKDNQIPVDKRFICHKDYTFECGYNALRDFFNKNGRFPEAIFTASYVLLEGALRAVHAIMGTIPPDLKIATFDDHPLLNYLPNHVLSVRQDYDRLAEASFEILLRTMNGEGQVEHRQIKPELIIR